VPADELTAAPASLRGGPLQTTVQYVLATLWVGVIPALLAGLALRYLVPPEGDGFAAFVSWAGHRCAPYFAVGMFFLFAVVVRYWRYHLPGGRYASALPAHLVPGERHGGRLARWATDVAFFETLRAGPVRRRTERTLDIEKRTAVDAALAQLRAGILSGDTAAAGEARRRVETAGAPVLSWSRRRQALETVVGLALSFLGLLALRAKVVQSYEVTSASMLPTLEPQDQIAGNKIAYARGAGPKRGDVILFRTSAVALPSVAGLPLVLAKRVVGLPGDRVSMNGSAPVINGWEVPGCEAGDYLALPENPSGKALQAPLFVEFLGDRVYLTLRGPGATFRGTYVVKPGEVFVLGDNRGNSMDSRAFNHAAGGGVPLDAVEARAQWFLVGTHRSGEPDFGRFLHSIDDGAARLRMEGLDAAPLEAAVARCLGDRPERTDPPPPGEGLAAEDAGR
jgi:signal peptidase I